MENEAAINGRILDLTVQIREEYPELYRNLHEMYATLPVVENPVINSISLKRWYDSLKGLVTQYESCNQRNIF